MAAEAKAFNDSLNIPYNWSLVSKIVLSGLSQHGHGDGTNKRTVHHIQLLEPVEYGRLKREPGDLLCRANHGSYDLSGAPDTGKVTCRQCLKLAERWKECLTEPKQHPYINSDTSEHYSLRDLLD